MRAAPNANRADHTPRVARLGSREVQSVGPNGEKRRLSLYL